MCQNSERSLYECRFQKSSLQVKVLLYFAKFLTQHLPFILLLPCVCGQSENLIAGAQNACLDVAVAEHFTVRGFWPP